MAFAVQLADTSAQAFSLDTYTANSVLSQGRWVKISVGESGIYALSKATLQRMGFSDPSRVRIYGYGALKIADVLRPENYVDDLPPVQSIVGERGSVIFYAQGPDFWKRGTTGRYTRQLNFYTTRAYYYVTEAPDSVDVPEIPNLGMDTKVGEVSETIGRIHHEQNIATPGESSAELVGEDFRLTPSRKFSFNMPEHIDGTPVQVECSFVARTISRSSTVEITAAGATPASNTLTISPTISDDSYYGSEGIGRYEYTLNGSKLDLTLRHSSPVTVHGAWLNYLAINYRRRLVIPSEGYIAFPMDRTVATLGGAQEGVRVWDVTEASAIKEMKLSELSGDKVAWTNFYTGNREYVAFNPSARFPEPTVEGAVANQNLHSIQEADMIIVTLPAWSSQAERVAQLHANDADDPLNVVIVNAADIYNEFGSGAPDPGTMRRFFKMVYDRTTAAGRPLRYVLLMGRYTYDLCYGTEDFRKLGLQTIPSCYNAGMSPALNDKLGYGTDDIMAMLADGSGYNLGTDKLSIGIGRMPVRSLEEATSDVDKLYDYVNKSRNTTWRNQVFVLADDQDNGVHMNQANAMTAAFNPEDSPNYVVNKVYIDAFTREGSTYPQAREAMFRYLDEGAMFWIYLGHANNHEWTHDGQLTFTDINEMYLKHIPVLFAGTCEFARWDSNTLSGAEIMYHERYGGVVAMITATRPVYISDNGYYSQSLGRAMGTCDSQGRHWRVGDLYRLSKNDIRGNDGKPISDTNRLRYILMGDPALRLAIPDNRVRLESIDGVPVGTGEQPVIPALGRPRLTGTITDPLGNHIADFNGTLQVTIYDASHSTTSNGYGEQGTPVTFEEHGSKLYTGILNVAGGRFDAPIAMPSEIADNFRPALASFYAFDESTSRHAGGVSSDFYVYGIDEQAAPDTIPPVIELLKINDENFENGGTVNTSPSILARVRDDVGINISSSGIGHQMTVQLDGKRSFNNVSDYFTPASDGSPSGQVLYPLSNLMPGNHTLTFRVWDTSGNSAESQIDFFVDPKATPRLYDIYSDSNPASTAANFYITTDRPDQMVTVSVTVYNLLGNPLWTRTVTGVNDMFTTTPVTWNLCDSAGRRVPRGIYLYRATITDNGETFDTGSRRIAVTAR